MKRIFTLLLTLVLALSLLPTASAYTPTGLTWDGAPATLQEIAQKTGYDLANADGAYKPMYAYYAESLWNLGLFLGSNGSFDLDQPLTRESGIVMILRLLGTESEAKAQNLPCEFSDVSDWAKPYVAYAVANGITNGIGGGKFGGTDAMSANQYITFILRVMGYKDNVDFQWDKAADKALEIGLIGESCRQQYTRSNLFLRDNAVVIADNALYTDTMKDGSSLYAYVNFPGKPDGAMPAATAALRDGAAQTPVEPTPAEPTPTSPAAELSDLAKQVLYCVENDMTVLYLRRESKDGRVTAQTGGNGFSVDYNLNLTINYVNHYGSGNFNATSYVNSVPYRIFTSKYNPDSMVGKYYSGYSLSLRTLEQAQADMNSDALTQELLDDIKKSITNTNNGYCVIVLEDGVGRYVIANVSNYSGSEAFLCTVFNIDPDSAGFGTKTTVNLHDYK